MNNSKIDSGWILCPSTTFPGKFYYFNVLTGETAWSLGNAEKRLIRKNGDIPYASENHHHPEPSSPPLSDNPTVSVIKPRFSSTHPCSQHMFPKSSLVKPKQIIWTPIHIRVPVVLSNSDNTLQNRTQIQTENIPPEMPNQINTLEKIVQTPFQTDNLSPTLSNSKEICVQTSGVPLCRRFVNYEQPVINFNKNNKIEDKEQFDRFFTSTPMEEQSKKSTATKIDIFKPKNNIGFAYLKTKNTATKQLIKESVFNMQIPTIAAPETNFEISSRITDVAKTSVFNFEIPSKMPDKPQNNFELPSRKPDKTKMAGLNFEVRSKTPEMFQNSSLISEVASKTPEKTQNIELSSKVFDMAKRSVFNFKAPSKTPEKFPKSCFNYEIPLNIPEQTQNIFELPSRTPDKTKTSVFDFEVQPKTPDKSQKSCFYFEESSNTAEKTQTFFDPASKPLYEPKKAVFNIGVPSKTVSALKSSYYFEAPSKTSEKTQNNFELPLRSPEIIQKPVFNMIAASKSPKKFNESSFNLMMASKIAERNNNFKLVNNSPDETRKSVFNIEAPPVKISKPNFDDKPSSPAKNIFYYMDQKEPSNDFSQAKNSDVPSGSDEKLDNFDIDLRMLLLAKKRKTLECSQQSTIVVNKKPRTQVPQKKKVTFNLDIDYESALSIEHCEDGNITFTDKYLPTVQCLKDLVHPGMNQDWCLVPDLEVLMKDMVFLGGFVQIDQRCRLVIPSAVYREVLLTARGDSRARSNANCARNVVRCVDSPYVIVQSRTNENVECSMNDAIIQCCMELTGKNINVILVSNDQELEASAQCYSIHCYNMDDIKNGLAPKSKPATFKHMKITIQNKPNTIANGSDQLDVDLNDKEKEIIRNFNHIVANSNKISTANDISNVTPKINSLNRAMKRNEEGNVYSDAFFENLMESTIPTANSNAALNKTYIKDQTNTNIISHDVDNSYYNSNVHKGELIPAKITANQTFTDPKNTKEMTHCNLKELNGDIPKISAGLKTPNLEWRYEASDITDTTIEYNMARLNITKKEVSPNTTPEKTSRNCNSPETNETVSIYFQKPSPRYDFSKLKMDNKRQSASKRFGQKTIDEQTAYFVDKENKTEIKEPHPKIVTEKSIFCFESDTLERPQNQRIQFANQIPLSNENTNGQNEIENNCDINSNNLCGKEIESRLKDRMDEWICSFIQVMEAFLTETLEKLPPSTLKGMLAPWSLYEALQCTRYVYKDHTTVKSVIQQLCGYLYETDFRNDKLKKTISPNDFMKALECGTQLVKHLKSITQDSYYVFDAEKSLNTILNDIKYPENNDNELIDETPSPKANMINRIIGKEIGQHFVKNNSDVVSYLKKHFNGCQNYDDYDNSRKKELENKDRRENRDQKQIAIDQRNKELESKARDNYLSNNITSKQHIGNTTTFHREVSETIIFNDTSKLVSANHDLEHAKSKQMHNDLNNSKKFNNQTHKQISNSIELKDKGDRNKFNRDTLGVKITIPNDYKNRNGIRNSQIDSYSQKDDKQNKIKPADDAKESKLNGIGSTAKVSEGPKIIRNMNLMEEFENKIKTRKYIDPEELNHSRVSETCTNFDDDETHCSDNEMNNSHINESRVIPQQNYSRIDGVTSVNHSKTANDRIKSSNDDLNLNSNTFTTDIAKNNTSNQRQYNVETIDGEFGKESPEIYRKLKIFTAELVRYFESINGLIEGNIQDMREGRLDEETKKSIRLKAFENNHMLSKIVAILVPWIQKENSRKDKQNGSSYRENVLRSTKAVLPCLQEVKKIHRVMNTIISTSEGSFADPNSSMSLNLSS